MDCDSECGKLITFQACAPFQPAWSLQPVPIVYVGLDSIYTSKLFEADLEKCPESAAPDPA